jgi:hypothetical protein
VFHCDIHNMCLTYFGQIEYLPFCCHLGMDSHRGMDYFVSNVLKNTRHHFAFLRQVGCVLHNEIMSKELLAVMTGTFRRL